MEIIKLQSEVNETKNGFVSELDTVEEWILDWTLDEKNISRLSYRGIKGWKFQKGV